MLKADYKNTSNSKSSDGQIWQWQIEAFHNDLCSCAVTTSLAHRYRERPKNFSTCLM